MAPTRRDRPQRPLPRLLALALVLVLVEAAALTVVALALLARWVRAGLSMAPVELFLLLFSLAVAATLVASVRALHAGRRVGRAPVVTWQLLQGATGATLLGSAAAPVRWAAVMALVMAVTVVVALVTRAGVEYTTGISRSRPAPP